MTLFDYSVIQLAMAGPIDILRFGDTISFTENFSETNFEARIVSDPLSTAHRANSRIFLADFTDDDLSDDFFNTLHGGSIFASPLEVNLHAEVVIPTEAINHENERQYVYLYEDGMLKKRYIQIGFFYGDRAQVIEGLEPGQIVAVQ